LLLLAIIIMFEYFGAGGCCIPSGVEASFLRGEGFCCYRAWFKCEVAAPAVAILGEGFT